MLRTPTWSVLASLALVACRGAPDEPRPAAPPAAPSRPPAPSLDVASRSVAEALGVPRVEVFAVSAPAPAGARVVGFTRDGIPGAALVEAAGAWLGRDGAERALAAWSAQGAVPDASQLARAVGALVYPGAAVQAAGDGAAPRGPDPAVTSHPGGGRVLTFSFVIPARRPGAGLHVARWRWTDSGLLIEASPHPERR
jgi:hypothetical protein